MFLHFQQHGGILAEQDAACVVVAIVAGIRCQHTVAESVNIAPDTYMVQIVPSSLYKGEVMSGVPIER